MKVYKFGGASVCNGAGVRNVIDIVSKEREPLIVVVSAMGKTTNAMEEVLHHYLEGNGAAVSARLEQIRQMHVQIMDELSLSDRTRFESLFSMLAGSLGRRTPADSYERSYDDIVSYGELLSTAIVASYARQCGISTEWIDMRRTLITDSRHREASVDFGASASNLRRAVGCDAQLFVMQGFIGGTTSGHPTTLGREGSDYTAAAVASMLGCHSVTIWKDVDGILSADPRIFPSAALIERLSYVDAVELAYSGAQIIHPKTIKPLHNKNIPLYVRPFAAPERPGSCICNFDDYTPPAMPVLILKRNQILLSIEPKDFSFVIEESLAEVFAILNSYGQKVNMVQTSAVRISVSIDASRYFSDLVADLQRAFSVRYNDNLELLTIRGYTPEVIERESAGHTIYIRQQTRRSIRLLRDAVSMA
ncbi:MAG: aspartate kinase [Rikenellaceae bacterium]|nr:aspartate kinase [Rikenellaceae bacterium]